MALDGTSAMPRWDVPRSLCQPQVALGGTGWHLLSWQWRGRRRGSVPQTLTTHSPPVP